MFSFYALPSECFASIILIINERVYFDYTTRKDSFDLRHATHRKIFEKSKKKMT